MVEARSGCDRGISHGSALRRRTENPLTGEFVGYSKNAGSVKVQLMRAAIWLSSLF